MAGVNVVIPSAAEVRLYEDRIIAQVENESFFAPLTGEVNDANAFVYRPDEMYKKGRYWTVHLRKAIGDPAITNGGTYSGNEKKSIISTADIEIEERGLPFGGFKTIEEMKTILNLREIHQLEAEQWSVMDHDRKFFDTIKLAIASLPTRAARDASQYNVEYMGDAAGWDDLNDSHFITAKGIARANTYLRANRGLRYGQFGPGKMGFIYILPSAALHYLGQEDVKFREALTHTLPRSEDHIFYKGHGVNPWGAWDGSVLVEDCRPVYASDNSTFLHTEDVGDYMKFEGIVLAAQGIGYAEWQAPTWYEEVDDHGRKYSLSVTRAYGVAKTVINLGTLNSASNREYGIGYFCATCPKID